MLVTVLVVGHGVTVYRKNEEQSVRESLIGVGQLGGPLLTYKSDFSD